MLMRARRRRRPAIRGLLVAEARFLPIRDACVDSVVAMFVCCVQADRAPPSPKSAECCAPVAERSSWNTWFRRHAG
jgi:hypothetical protein